MLIITLALLSAASDPIAVSVPVRDGPVSYAEEVAEILGARCVGCHNGALSESKLVLEDVPAMLRGGERGPAIVPGKADESLLFRLASHRAEPNMPPADKPDHPPLTPEELGVLKLWIDAGARDDSAEVAARPVELGTLPPGVHPIVAVDLTADGRLVACGRANLVQVYDVDSGLEIASLAGHRDIIQSLRFSPDGSKLAAGSYGTITLWNAPTGGEVQTLSGHEGEVVALAVAEGGKLLISGDLDGVLRVRHADDGKERFKVDLPSEVRALAVSPDGRLVAVGGADGTVRTFDLVDGSPADAWRASDAAIESLAFHPDGRLASGAEDGSVSIWARHGSSRSEPEGESGPHAKAQSSQRENAEEGTPFFALLLGDLAPLRGIFLPESPAPDAVLRGHHGPIHAVAAAPDGRLVVTGGEDGTVQVWDARTGRRVAKLPSSGGPVRALAVGPRGDVVLAGSADGKARLFDLPGGRLLRTLAAHRGPVRGVAFSPDGSRLATVGEEGGLMVWEADTGRKVIAFGHGRATPSSGPKPLRAVAFTAGDGLASASADGTLKTWRFEGSWSEWKTLGPVSDRVLALDFNPDGTLLAAGAGEPSRSGEVTIWETGKGLLIHRLAELHSDSVCGLAFSPDGRRLATASADKFLKVVDVTTGSELRSFEGHNHHVLAVDWSADGKRLATGGADGVLKVWDDETGEPLRSSRPVDKQITAVRWSRNQGTQFVAGACGDRVVRSWNPNNMTLGRTFEGPSGYVYGVALSADRARVAAGGADGVLHLWDGETGEVIRKVEP